MRPDDHGPHAGTKRPAFVVGGGGVMPYAKITRQWPDGSVVVTVVGTEGDPHPDLLDELVRRCRDLDRDAAPDEADE